MTPERWQLIKSLYAEAEQHTADERVAFLEEACADDPALRDEVWALLQAAENPSRVDQLAQQWVSPLLRDLHARAETGGVVGRYELVHEIGRGGMGVVYRARDPRLGRDVGLKLLAPALSAQQQAKARFLTEARAASALDHPNICTIYEADETEDGRLYIAMAYYDGPTLKDRLQAGRLSVEESIRLALQVAEGLQCAHSAGIIHRDIKPANLIVTPPGTLKILDFGIAKLEGDTDLTKPGAKLGTIAYMAPEQVRGEPVDERADLWALGVVLYELLTGNRPFTGAHEQAVIHNILHAELPDLATIRPDVPATLARVVQRALARDPAQRFQRAAAFIAALQQVEDRPSSLPERKRGVLPKPLTSLVGRTREAEQLVGLLARGRLLTLTGPGGIGKTRLGMEVATRVAADFPDGVVFVSLAPIADPALVTPAIAHVFDVTESASRSVLGDLKQMLRARCLLLVLDNFEQVQAAASVVAELLVACPALKVLVTSRTPLGLRAEQEYPVPPLEGPGTKTDLVPDALLRCTAVQLFVERARAVRPDFELTPGNAEAVAALCRRLDGLPLAIELAAARIKLFPPAVLLERLARRLDVLKGRASDRPARHRTLQQAIAWSYDLLDESLQGVFRQLSVFAGGFTLEAAEAVLRVDTVVIDALATLLDHSLLQRTEDEAALRFYMLETIRTFGLTRLQAAGEAEEVRRRHALYVLERAEQAEAEMTGPGQAAVFDHLEADHDNLRAALAFAEAQHNAELGLRLGAALWRFWIVRNYIREGRQWMQRMLAVQGDVPPPVRARALNGVATIAHNQGDNTEARSFLEESLALWRSEGEQQGIAAVLNNLSWVACELSDLEVAHALSREALDLCTHLEDRRGMALALNNLGWVAFYKGNARDAIDLQVQSLALRRAVGDRRGVAFALANLAAANRIHGAYDRASDLLREALHIADPEKDAIIYGWVRSIQGEVAYDQGACDRAVEVFEGSVALARSTGNRSGLAWALTDLGSAMLDQGDASRARALLEEALSNWTTIACPWGIAWATWGLGRVAREEQNAEAAYSAFQKSLALREDLGDCRGRAECLEAVALLDIERGASAEARRRFQKAVAMRETAAVPVPPNRRAEVERLIHL